MFPFGELKQILWGERRQEQFQCNVPQLSNDLPQMKWMPVEIILWLGLVSNYRGWLKANVTSFSPLISLLYILCALEHTVLVDIFFTIFQTF